MKNVTIQVPIEIRRKSDRNQTANVAVAGRIPRVAKLMALAIKFEGLVERGEVADYAELARLGGVTRARLTQIMALTRLAPDIQEAILFLPPVAAGRDPVSEREMRPITARVTWKDQRAAWRHMTELTGPK